MSLTMPQMIMWNHAASVNYKRTDPEIKEKSKTKSKEQEINDVLKDFGMF